MNPGAPSSSVRYPSSTIFCTRSSRSLAICCWTSASPGPSPLSSSTISGVSWTALDQRLQEGVFQGIEGRGILQAGPPPVRVIVGSTREAAIQEKAGKHLHQRLQVDRVEPATLVLRIGREAHGTTLGGAPDERHEDERRP